MISPVPATNLPPVRFMGSSLSTMPRANMSPALGPPMSPTLMLTLSGKWNFTVTTTPMTG